MPTDLEQLLDMGFDKVRSEIAVKKTGGLQGALQWLEDNQDKSLDEIQAAAEASKDDDEDDADTRAQIAELEAGHGQARSLICNDCGKRFRNHDLASYHATKTEHTDFSESTEEIAPLTEDQKKAKLEELRERLQAKKAVMSMQDKEEHKLNEKIRQKATKETQDAKEDLARKEQIKEATKKRQEKLEDLEAKKRIKAKIEADKAERRRKAEEAKAAREGRIPEPAVTPAAAAAPKPKSDRTDARLRLQTESGNITKTLPSQDLLTRYGAPAAHVVDNWWSTEAGSPITGRALVPHAGHDRTTPERDHPPPEIKPGSAGKAMPGFDVRIVDDEGAEVARGTMGNIVLGMPLAPTGFRTLWGDEERFYRGYLKRFQGKWLDTGDSGWIDEEGYVHVMSRNDDVLNVSAHRLSSGGIEQAVASHPLVAECCVVGVPDALKGQLPFAFITLSTPDHPASAVPDERVAAEIQALVRSQVGAIASLGGIVQGKGMIPKTRSGKTLRRVMRELVDNAVHGEFDAPLAVPSTIDDAGVVEVARDKVKEYFERHGGRHGAVEERAKAKL